MNDLNEMFKEESTCERLVKEGEKR